jgi:ArsR family transcriptional regulator, arsenate/arsenite/antimonite-responsive transcriptional repressor / arsenate reductase (thioredoxin)
VRPPAFLRLGGHQLRWRLLTELARSDRRVFELVDLVGEQQSLVSYHLGTLRAAGLVAARRSSADGRDTYYSADLTRCVDLLASAGAALHPGLRLQLAPSATGPRRRATRRRVLFLCTRNSTRSQMAEALLGKLTGGRVTAASAGSQPKPLHPNAVRVMSEYSLDIRDHRSKHLSEFAAQRFDYVITLCDRVREVCPQWPDNAQHVHWSMPDPAAWTGRASHLAFRRVAAELSTRIGFLVSTLEPLGQMESR